MSLKLSDTRVYEPQIRARLLTLKFDPQIRRQKFKETGNKHFAKEEYNEAIDWFDTLTAE